MIKVNLSNADLHVDKLQKHYGAQIAKLHESVNNATCAGNGFLGWRDWPNRIGADEVARISAKAKALRDSGVDTLLVIGIGGSYLGARAAIEMSNGLFGVGHGTVLFAGNTLSPSYLKQLYDHLANKKFAINVVSKSGGTLEPAVSFRLFRQMLESRFGKDVARTLIFATTDAKGTLADIAKAQGYETFVVPPDIGGRFSVLTPVGLFPMAFAGIDIHQALEGAKKAIVDTASDKLSENEAYKYAAGRFDLLVTARRSAEMLVAYDPQLQSLVEWWKQLFGESEGKEGKGLLPHGALFTTDLHSLGQFIQSGSKVLFETVIKVKKPQNDLTVPLSTSNDDDKLDYVANKTLSELNEVALNATVQAHAIEGDVPNIVLELDELSAHSFGYFVQFMFRAVAISALLLGVNPFDQPGVEVYKRNIAHQLKGK